MTNPITLQQGSAAWLEYRLGNVTGSRVADALSVLTRKSKTGEKGESSAARRKYLIELVCERLTGRATDHYVSPAMDWGTENEKYARAAYEVVTGNEVDLVGIAVHPTIPHFMASPDGFIGEDGIFEAKCPNTETHIQYLMDDVVPPEYVPQLLAEMACSGRKWADFMSFDPRLPVKLQVFIKRLERDDEQIAEMEAGVIQFLAEVDALTEKLGGRQIVAPKEVSPSAQDEALILDEDIAWIRAKQAEQEAAIPEFLDLPEATHEA